MRAHVRPVRFRELAVGDGVDRLHRSDCAGARKAPDVLGIDALRVLDAGSPVTPGPTVRGQRVESPADRAISDCVQANVQLGLRAPSDHVDQVLLRESHCARTIEHLGGPAPQ